MRHCLLIGTLWLALTTGLSAGEIEFVEDFALARDRATALKQLVPGTEDFYYYHALHYLQTEQLDKIENHLITWVQRHGETPRVEEIRTRYAFASYEKDPQKSLAFLRERLGLNYPHQKEELNVEPQFPTTLDAKIISREAFTERANAVTTDDTNLFEDTSFDWLVSAKLNPNHRRSLLARLTRPDYATLVKLVVDDLNHENSGGFGSHPIHRQMLLPQLEELLKAKPELLNQQNFVLAYLTKLQPTADENWRHEPERLEAYLNRLQSFANRLSPIHNSLKAHVLYQRLVLDRLRGVYDRARFIEYLKLPRRVVYLSRIMNESEDLKRFATDLTADYGGTTLLEPIGNDEALVRSYLAHFLVDAANVKEFEPYINDVYLRHLFAEVKILNGLGAEEQWASLLPPALFQQLKERVDIDFAFTNKTQFAPDEPVKLDLFVKNTGTLIVKVFEINTRNYYRDQQREVDTDINLDGLVANVEQTHPVKAPPLRRMAQRFEFPQLDKPGVYIVDFIGNGRSSRALIRKGRLRHIVRTTPFGQAFTILDEKSQPIPDATIWLAGHEYKSVSALKQGESADSKAKAEPQGKKPAPAEGLEKPGASSSPSPAAKTAEGQASPVTVGTILVPFTSNPTRQPIVITHGNLSSLDYFQHEAENHALTAAFHVDRESLIQRKTAQLIVRAGLLINGTPVSIKRLEDIELKIASTDLDGISSSQVISNFVLYEDRESTHEFQVPRRLASLTFTLTAKVKKLSAGEHKIDLSASDAVTLNGIDKTEKIETLHLLRNATGYVAELRGKTGEPKPSRPVQFAFKHRDFRQVHHAVLKTDPAGRIQLGELLDIVTLSAVNPENTQHTWNLVPDRFSYSRSVHGIVGESIQIPFFERQGASSAKTDEKPEKAAPKTPDAGESRLPERADLSLLEIRNDSFVIDRFEHARLQGGMLLLEKLPAGDYDLYLKASATQIRIRVTAGPKLNHYVLGRNRQLEIPPLPPLQIQSIQSTDTGVKIQLQNASKFTRVHVFATRYTPEYDAFAHLSRVRGAEPYLFQQSPAQSVYLTGRNIGDEYRYIIDRKYAPKFPGNTLDRPSLLLNPWAVRSTQTGVQQSASGGEFAKSDEKPASDASRDPGLAPASPATTGNFANLDFLAEASLVLVNLVPNDRGFVEIKSEVIGPHQHLHVVAVDPIHTSYRSIALSEPKIELVDLRLTAGLDPKGHYTQQKQITRVDGGKAITIHDITTSKYEIYDSLTNVYALYSTIKPDPKLTEFGFLLNWPKLKIEEKRTLYSKHACHELNFFLFRKDPEFFNTVVKPFLANKLDPTFLDHYLLGHDLSEFTLPWNHSQLNVVERILLGQRLQAERRHMTRHVQDLYALLPPRMDQFIHLFDTALQQSALELFGSGKSSLRWEKTLSLQILQAQDKANLLNAPAPAVDAPAPAPAPDAAPESEARARYAAPTAAGRPASARQMLADEAKRESGMARRKLAESVEKSKKQMAAKDGTAKWNRDEADQKHSGAKELKERVEFLHEDIPVELQVASQLYRELGVTLEWAENNYHQLPFTEQNSGLITVNGFWKDYAEHDPATPFVSVNLAESSRNFSEMVMALAVLDLPFESPKLATQLDALKLTLSPTQPLVVFHEQIQASPAADGAAKVLVSQNFYRYGDRTRMESGEQVDKFVNDEFLIQVVYGCQIVITNPTSTKQKLNILLQIPRGSVPVLNSQATKTVHLDLEPYHTQTLEYHFYFPLAGKFPQFPVHVAKNEVLIASAEPIELNVVNKATKVDMESWDYVSQFGTADAVFTFLDKHNVSSLSLSRIAWRMHDPEFFAAVIAKLTQRHVYDDTLWSYSLKHNVLPAAREYLQHSEAIINRCGGRLNSPLLTIDPVRRKTHEHLEYKPLVNARAHSLGKRRQIVNDRFYQQYHHLMKQLSYVRELDDEDLLTVTYYLLLQDRIEEALATFDRVNREKLSSRLQYDYCAAYLNFFTDDHQQAREIAAKYVDHPVDRWRQTFAAITSQLDEAEGHDLKPVNPEDRNQQQTLLAASEPSFDVTVEAKQIRLNHQNLKSVRVNFYEMDVELLFSRNPFVQQFQGQFSSIKPNHTLDVKLSDDVKLNKGGETQAAATGKDVKDVPNGAMQARNATQSIALPPALHNKNVLVEVVGAGVTKTQAYYSHSLSVQVIENYGQIKVTHETTGRPVSKAYVKVYAQTSDGQVKYYKDGYTDLRGRFDYSSLSTDDLKGANKFAILVLSNEFGALVREATPPKR